MKGESVEHTLKIIIEKFAPRPYHFAATKGNTQLVRELDEAIFLLQNNRRNLSSLRIWFVCCGLIMMHLMVIRKTGNRRECPGARRGSKRV